MDKEEKEYKLIKLHLENSRTHFLGFMSLLITSFIGAYTIKPLYPEASLIIFQLASIFIFGMLVMYFVSSHYYNKAKTYLGEPKTVRILKNFIINNKFLILLLIILALVLGEIVLFVRIF